jgi:TolB-like protein
VEKGKSQTPQTEVPLESWKAIANYLQREVRTAQRWEQEEGLPVHRHEHKKQATVYAFQHEIDAWRVLRKKAPVTGSTGGRKPGWIPAAIILLVLLAITTWWVIRSPDGADTPATQKLIVVLPFQDLSHEPLVPLADALTEEIGARLASANPERLAVIARTSAMTFKARESSIEEIRQHLSVDYALEGSIRRDGGMVRITAQLFDTGTRVRLWGASFDYTIRGWLELQQQAATDIIGQIGTALSIDQVAPKQATLPDPGAYEHVLLGRHYFDQFNPDTLAQASQHFTSALSNDPNYVEAHVGLALTQVAGAFFGIMPAATSYREAVRSANIALDLDPDNGDALAILGWVEFVYRWNWAESERLMRRAVESQPNSPWTHWFLANYLSAMDRPGNAVAAINAALRLDPVSPYGLIARGYILDNAGQDAEAVEHCLAVHNRLGLPLIAGFLIGTYESAGDFDSAIGVAEDLALRGNTGLRPAYSVEGEEGYWKAIATGQEEILTRYPDLFSYRYAVALSKIGELDKAIDMLEHGYRQRDPRMVFLPVYPLQTLYGEPRFRDLVKRMNLEDVIPDV